uniref:G-protein coupled receptor-associated protein LMBRD2 n=1 Tax=Myxine glutinosa TaxID=7769 RepID=UPI00358EEDE0
MSSWLLLGEVVLAVLVSLVLLRRYGDVRRQSKLVLVATTMAWCLSCLMLATLPLDVATTIYRQCVTRHRDNGSTLGSSDSPCSKPWSFLPSPVLPIFWHVVYWTSQFLTWLLLPFMQSFSAAADFSVMGKVRSALLANAIYYGSYLIIFTSLLIYVLVATNVHLDAFRLRSLCAAASNTWGLLLVILLLGRGLLEVPRSLWRQAGGVERLHRAYLVAARLATERAEADDKMSDCIEDVQRMSAAVSHNQILSRHLDTIIKKFPNDIQEKLHQEEGSVEWDDSKPSPSEASLVCLHKSVKKAVEGTHRASRLWSRLIEEAFHLEDVELCSNSPSREFHRSLASSSQPPAFLGRSVLTARVQWLWFCFFRSAVCRILAFFMVLLSFAVLWSECTFFSASPVLSLFAIALSAAEKAQDYTYIHLSCFLTILYLSLCTYHTVFRIRFFHIFQLIPHQQTNHYSLLFSGSLFCRLTPPLCLNLLGLLHLDSHVVLKQRNETAYTEIMGHMDVVPFIADGVYIYYPMVTVLVCLATYFHLGTRSLSAFGLPQCLGDELISDSLTSDLVEEGRELIRREKRKRQRLEDADLRKKEWKERFGTNENGCRGVAQEPEKFRTDTATKGSSRSRGQEGLGTSDRIELLSDVEPMDFNEDQSLEELEMGTESRYQPAGRYASLSRTRNFFDDL